MSLNPIRPGLRAIKHNAVSVSKVQLSVPAGDVLHVSDNVADQLVAAAGEFQEITDDEPVEQATAAPGEVRAVKRPAKKSAAAKPKE
jgi:sulfite reductase alpha subunit-like flavoprotein